LRFFAQLDLHQNAYPHLYESVFEDEDAERATQKLNEIVAGPVPPVNSSPFAVPNLHYAFQEVINRSHLGQDKENG
jgi:hypothetical protein